MIRDNSLRRHVTEGQGREGLSADDRRLIETLGNTAKTLQNTAGDFITGSSLSCTLRACAAALLDELKTRFGEDWEKWRRDNG